MNWIKFSKYNLPPQGLKILCFKKGDLWVARRFEYKGASKYLEIPFGGCYGANLTDEPEYWMQLNLPENYSGYMKICFEDSDPMDFDELQNKYPKEHEEFVELLLNTIAIVVPGHSK